MPRDVDERKKRQALRKLRKAAELAESGLGPPLSDWEVQFLEEVEQRIETYGSAFADPEKGGEDEPLSALQKVKLKEIDKKARGKGPKRGGFKSKKSGKNAPRRSYGRDIHEDLEPDPPAPEPAAPPRPKPGSRPRPVPHVVEVAPPDPAPDLVPNPSKDPPPQPPPAEKKRPIFRVIDGGKQESDN